MFVIVDEKERTLERSYNKIHFTAQFDFDEFQIDLAENMEILSILFPDSVEMCDDIEPCLLEYSREHDAVFVKFPRTIKKGEQSFIIVWYTGYPREAVNPLGMEVFLGKKIEIIILGLEFLVKDLEQVYGGQIKIINQMNQIV